MRINPTDNPCVFQSLVPADLATEAELLALELESLDSFFTWLQPRLLTQPCAGAHRLEIYSYTLSSGSKHCHMRVACHCRDWCSSGAGLRSSRTLLFQGWFHTDLPCEFSF